jgi:hypothetical protein
MELPETWAVDSPNLIDISVFRPDLMALVPFSAQLCGVSLLQICKHAGSRVPNSKFQVFSSRTSMIVASS